MYRVTHLPRGRCLTWASLVAIGILVASQNCGTATTPNVGGGSNVLIQFNLGALPPGTIASDIDHASLILFVNKVTTAGSVAVQAVTSTWTESDVTYNTAPGLGGVIATVLVPASSRRGATIAASLLRGPQRERFDPHPEPAPGSSPQRIRFGRHTLQRAVKAAPHVAKVAVLGLALCAAPPQSVARSAVHAVESGGQRSSSAAAFAGAPRAEADAFAAGKVLRKEYGNTPAREPFTRESAARSNDAAAAPSGWIDRIKRPFIAVALFAALAANAAQAPGPWGIDDPQIAAGVLRTEYNDPHAGTDGHPLNVDCGTSADPATCGNIETVFRASNSYTNAAVVPGASYWMLTINNDKSFVERCEEYGPPDQSIPIDEPGAGLAGVGVSAGPQGNVIDLEVDQVDYRNPCGSAAAPFVGFGAHWGRGNSTPVGYLNAEGSVTTFNSRLVEFASSAGFVYARHWLFAIATWGGVRHFAAVHLFALDGDEQGRLAAPEDNGLTSNWKWPYVDSWYYPGASIAVFPAWAVGLPTLQPELDVHYAVDWQRVFEKAWPDMPRDPIAIEAVAFANEIAGVVRLHVAVSDVQQTSSSSRPNVSFQVNGGARIEADPGQPLHYVWQADNALGVLFSWQTHDSRCSFESPSGLWQPNTPSGALKQSMQTAQSGCIYDIVVTAYSFNGVASDGITVAVR